MEQSEITMDDIVTLINNSDDEFIIYVELGEENAHEKREESF